MHHHRADSVDQYVRRAGAFAHCLATSYKAGRTLGVYVLVLLCLDGGSALAQEKAEGVSCPSLWGVHEASSPSQDWLSDVDYLTWSPKAKVDHVSEYVVGETLVLSKKNFKHLSKTASSSLSKLDTLTFDAQKIVVDMPVFLNGGSVRFLAREVQFTRRGQIIFTGKPEDASSDSVSIVADTLDMTQALVRPFAFVTNGADFAEVRKITVDVRNLRRRNAGQRADDYFKSTTLNEPYGSAPARGPVPQAFFINVGTESAARAYTSSLNSEMVWPEQLADKILRQYQIAPYDEERRRFLLAKIDEGMKAVSATRQEFARSSLLNTKAAIDLGLDTAGFHEYYVPRIDYTTVQNNFSVKTGAKLKLLSSWNQALYRILSRSFDEPRLRAVQENLVTNRREKETLDDAVTDALKSNVLLENEIGKLNQQIANAEANIRERRRDDQAKAETDRNLAIATKVLVMSTAFLPVAAPVAVGIGTAVGAAGDVVMSHQHGGGASVLSVGLSIPDALDRAQKYKALATTVSDNWSATLKEEKNYEKSRDAAAAATGDAKKDKDAARGKAFDATIDSGKKFFDSLKSMIGEMQVPGPTTLSMDSYEQKDELLQSLLRAVGDIRNQQAELNATLTSIAGKLATKRGEIDGLLRQEAALRAPTADNDLDAGRLEQLIWNLRASYYRELGYEVAVLLRAYAYRTGETLDDPSVSQLLTRLNNVASPARISENSRISGDARKEQDPSSVLKRLEDERGEIATLVSTLEDRVKTGYDRFLNGLKLHQTLFHSLALSCNAPNDRGCDFIKAVNMELARQAAFIGAAASTPAGVQRRKFMPVLIPIPVGVSSSAFANLEKIFSAQVTVRGDVSDDQSLQFSIVHPLAGRLHTTRGVGCFTVDMRLSLEKADPELYTTSCIGLKCTPPHDVDLKDIYKQENQKIVSLPLEAAYFFLPEIRDLPDPARVPAVSTISIKLLYMR